MKVCVFAMPWMGASHEVRTALRPLGRNTEHYRALLAELEQLVQAADELGFDAFGTTEHHFHNEGGEVLPNPLLFYTKLATMTERIQFLVLSIVLTAQHPIRIAEDIALFDNMFPGRLSVAFARGYQNRWVQTLMQRGDGVSLINPESDRINREIYDEHLEIVLKAWAEDSFNYKGKYVEIPYPYEGIPNWAGAEWTRAYGVGDEVDDAGTVYKIGVVPKPVTQPHPEICTVYTLSKKTLLDSAMRGFTSLAYESRPEGFRQACEEYREAAREAGHELRLGERMGAVRCICIGDTYEQAFDLAARSAAYEYHNYFNKFGMAEIFRTPADDPNTIVTFADERACAQRLIEFGQIICGTVDDVKRQIEDLRRCHADGDLDWLIWEFFAQGNTTIDEQRRQLELFSEKVLPSVQ